jgi:hypothetical protein
LLKASELDEEAMGTRYCRRLKCKGARQIVVGRSEKEDIIARVFLTFEITLKYRQRLNVAVGNRQTECHFVMDRCSDVPTEHALFCTR